MRSVGVTSGQLEEEPGVDRAEHRAARRPSTFRSSHSIFVAGEVGVEDEAGPLADEALAPRGAQLVAALGRAAVLPDQRPVDRLAVCRVPGDDGLALVGDPDRLELAGVDAGVGDRLAPRPAASSPRSRSASCSTQPGPREVLLELRVGPAGDPGLPSNTRQVVPVVPWSIARITGSGLTGVGLGPAHDRQQRLGEAGDVFFSGPEAAQGEPVHQGHDRAGVALGVGHLERVEGGLGDFFVGDEAAPRRVPELGIPGGAEVQLDLGQLSWILLSGLAGDPLDLDRDLLDAGARPAQLARRSPRAGRPPRRPAASGTRGRGRAGCRSGR